jgi:hypothetical protein
MRLAFLGLLTLACLSALGQESPSSPNGTWRGSYQPIPVQVPLVMQVERTTQGWSAKTQSPNQNFAFWPVDSLSVDKTHVSFVQSQFNVLFSATLAGNTLSGTLSQSGVVNKVFLVHILNDTAACAGVDSVVGEWRGTLELTSASMPFVLSVAGTGVNLGATTQTPSVNPTSFPVDSITYSGNMLSFRQAQFGVDFTGTIAGDVLSGTITQNGYKHPMVLHR